MPIDNGEGPGQGQAEALGAHAALARGSGAGTDAVNAGRARRTNVAASAAIFRIRDGVDAERVTEGPPCRTRATTVDANERFHAGIAAAPAVCRVRRENDAGLAATLFTATVGRERLDPLRKARLAALGDDRIERHGITTGRRGAAYLLVKERQLHDAGETLPD